MTLHGSIWDDALEITITFSKKPLHKYFVNFQPIIENLKNKNYETTSDWISDVLNLYSLASTKPQPRQTQEETKNLVNSLWKEFQKASQTLDFSDADDWREIVLDEVEKTKKKLSRCPFPYLYNINLMKLLEEFNESWLEPENIPKLTQLVQLFTSNSDGPDDRDISQYLIGDMRDKYVNMDNYKFIHDIGIGSFATVCLEKNKLTNKEVAVKYFRHPGNSGSNIRFADLFYREITALEHNQHPCVVPFIGFSTSTREKEPAFIILTQYFKNGSLRRLLDFELTGNQTQGWTPTQKSLVAFGIALGMQSLHKNGVIHRDLKSPNILLDDNYLPKIADLGLSKYLLEDSQNTQSIGSLPWMAPEVIRTANYGKKADVYSYAMIIYELLTSRLPYQEFVNIGSLRDAILLGRRPKIPSSTPDGISKLITRSWVDDPNLRPDFDIIVKYFLEEKCLFPGCDACEFLLGAAKLMGEKCPSISLEEAVERNFLPIVKMRLKLYPDEARNSTQFPLHTAVMINSVEIVSAVCPFADINSRDSKGMTALHIAVSKNYSNIVQVLLERPGIDINVKDNTGKTPIFYALEKGNNCLSLLFSHPEIDVNAVSVDGQTPLHVAVNRMNMSAVLLLLSSPVIDVSISDKNGSTPLKAATRKNFNEGIAVLMASGKVRMDTDAHKQLFLDAIKAGNTLAVMAMLQGSSISMDNYKGMTETPLSCAFQSVDMMMLILSQPSLKITPDHLLPFVKRAIEMKNMQEFCVMKASNLVIADYGNDQFPPPLVMAAMMSNVPFFMLLLSGPKVDINVQANSFPYYSALHYCAMNNCVEIGTMLLKYPGINKDLKEGRGMTPLQIATMHDAKQMIDLLK